MLEAIACRKKQTHQIKMRGINWLGHRAKGIFSTQLCLVQPMLGECTAALPSLNLGSGLETASFTCNAPLFRWLDESW